MSTAPTKSPSDPAERAGGWRCAFGSVQAVRDLPSRETTVITIEIPEEHHVVATSLLHGRQALIVQSVMKAGSTYGVVDLPRAGDATESDSGLAAACTASDGCGDAMPSLVHARVGQVRQVPSRMVTVIQLEVPNAEHVEITRLLHGRDAIILPVNLPAAAPFGILDANKLAAVQGKPYAQEKPSRKVSLRGQSADAANTGDTAQPASEADTDGSGSRSGFSSAPVGLGRSAGAITRWLGARCGEAEFQDFLQVRNEAAAIAAVRSMCGVESRADIPKSREAARLFMTMVHEPYERYQREKLRPAAAVQPSPIKDTTPKHTNTAQAPFGGLRKPAAHLSRPDAAEHPDEHHIDHAPRDRQTP